MKKAMACAWVLVLLVICLTEAHAAKKEGPKEAWVMCQPDSEVCVRAFPKKSADVVARVCPGDHIVLSGKKRGRWYHCIHPCEPGEGWIRGDFLSFTEPEIYPEGKAFDTLCGKLYARFSINGNKRVTLKKGVRVIVYMMAEEWSVTNKGYIMTKYLEEAAPDE